MTAKQQPMPMRRSSSESFGDLETSSVFTSSHEPSSMTPTAIIGAEESRRVAISRGILMFIFFLAATACGLATWFYTSGKEQEEFENAFKGLAEEVIGVSQINANSNFDSMKTLSDLVTTLAIASNATWPYVTHENWPAVAATAKERLGARFVATVPFVDPEVREEWENYTVKEQGWIQRTIDYYGDSFVPDPIIENLFVFDPSQENPFVRDDKPLDPEFPFYMALWQTTLVDNPPFINFNAWNDFYFAMNAKHVVTSGEPTMSQPFGAWDYDPEAVVAVPEALVCQPIFDSFEPDAKIVGILDAYMQLDPFSGILSEDGSDGIIVVLSNPCSNPTDFTWEINGQDAEYMGQGDLHDVRYSIYGVDASATELKTTPECPYTLHLYPSEKFEDQFFSSDPILFTVASVCIFVITLLFFFLYDFLVEKRQGTVLRSAEQNGALVDNIFPAAIRARLIEDEEENEAIFEKGEGGPLLYKTKPIADYYPVGTVFVADIANFSVWSSVREPAQVFSLLETLYSTMDAVAKKRKVYKVETLGDCYVACCNVPDPRKDHAFAVALFAKECRSRMRKAVHKLEIVFGPDTSALKMRYAIHSGPVTAGVLRGERSRFQLFGDTIDACFQLEKHAEPDQILVSKATADLIVASYGDSWLTPSKVPVIIKDKGPMDTFWLSYEHIAEALERNPSESGTIAEDQDSSSFESISGTGRSKQIDRLIQWNVDVLCRQLKMIIAMRRETNEHSSLTGNQNGDIVPSKHTTTGDSTVLDEVCEIIELRNDQAEFDEDTSIISLGAHVEDQLKNLISRIAGYYRPNDFHNFQHACHVTQTVTKLLSRVVTSKTIDTSTMTYTQRAESHELHQFTYGITSDPLIQFACALSAIIHDVDHPGVPNSQLVKEKTADALRYKNKSVAEQNSVELAWNMLMEPQYKDLRSCIYVNQEECDRFRQLVVNSVMATDIVDKELGQLRKNRWNKAFYEEDLSDESDLQQANRKATIVIEHLVQAADVSHMMQHWHVYIKWNEKFFRECYKAYLAGRAEKDPSIGWYKGELGFFDFYVIPLAKKLENCGVFGVSSDEFLQCAEANRKEWESKGEAMVTKYLSYFDKSSTV